MINLLEETIKTIAKHGHDPEEIIYIGILETGEACTWQDFKILADCEYHEGHSDQKVRAGLVIVFGDHSRLYRHNYDGSEEWRYIPEFRMPDHTRPINSLWTCSQDQLNKYWFWNNLIDARTNKLIKRRQNKRGKGL